VTRYLLVLVLAFYLTACSSKYRVDSYEAPTAHIDNQASFYVVLPVDGQYEGAIYQGSGAATAQAVSSALLWHVERTIVGTTPGEELTSALQRAKGQAVTHVFHTMILHWEDRATEWSGITDKVALKLAVYDAPTGKLISSTVARASSKWGTLGGDHPQDLLPELIKRFVDPLF
jgi:uncharacterized protein DUF4823